MLVEGKISKQYIRAKIQYQSTPTNTSTTRCIIIDNYILKALAEITHSLEPFIMIVAFYKLE